MPFVNHDGSSNASYCGSSLVPLYTGNALSQIICKNRADKTG